MIAEDDDECERMELIEAALPGGFLSSVLYSFSLQHVFRVGSALPKLSSASSSKKRKTSPAPAGPVEPLVVNVRFGLNAYLSGEPSDPLDAVLQELLEFRAQPLRGMLICQMRNRCELVSYYAFDFVFRPAN